MQKQYLISVTPETLRKITDTYTPFRVHSNNQIEFREDIPSPVLIEDKLDSEKWMLVTSGYSHQFGYSGPIMHDSEFVGIELASDILAEPGVYCMIVAQCWNEVGTLDCDGWAIARHREL